MYEVFHEKKKIYQLKRKEVDDHFFRYLMFKANLDVSNVTEPQTGQFEIQIGKNKLSFYLKNNKIL